MPRSALSMSAASVEFTHQLIQAIAASGFFVLADADHSMLALYQALRSVALPVRLGARSILISLPDAALIASSWLVLEACMAAFPTTTALWSSGLADGPCPSSLICWAVPMALAFSNLTIISNHASASATSNPRPSGVNSSLPFCRSQVPNMRV